MKKVMFVCSSGGHLEEMLKLESIFDKYDYVLVTEKTDITCKMKNKYKIEYLKYASRLNLFKYILVSICNVIKSIYLLLKFNPKVVITTGANTGGIVCFFGKVLFKKVIYIESLAKVKDLSSTGKIVYKFADKFYVQWEELSNKYSKAEYIGRLI